MQRRGHGALLGRGAAHGLFASDPANYLHKFSHFETPAGTFHRGCCGLTPHVFNVLNFAEIAALVFPENQPSIRVMLKLGFAVDDMGVRQF